MVKNGGLTISRDAQIKKYGFKTRDNWSKRVLPSQSRIPKRGRRIRRGISDIQINYSTEDSQNDLKRLRGEDITSGSTIITEYEPITKRIRKAYPILHSQDSSTSCSTLTCLYKNAHFGSESQKSVPNLLILSNLPYKADKTTTAKKRSYKYMDASISPRTSISEADAPENTERQVIVTSPDGAKKLIVLRKVVMMHVRETPACVDFSLINCKENSQRNSRGIRQSINSVEDLTTHQDHEDLTTHQDHEDMTMHLEDVNIINPSSTIVLLSEKNPSNLTNLGVKKSLSLISKQSVRSSRASSKCAVRQQRSTCEETLPESLGIFKSEARIPQKEIDISQMITERENQDPDENMFTDHGSPGKKEAFTESKQPLRLVNLPNKRAEPSAHSFQNPSTSTPDDVNGREESEMNITPCAFLLSVCFILKIVFPRLLNVML